MRRHDIIQCISCYDGTNIMAFQEVSPLLIVRNKYFHVKVKIYIKRIEWIHFSHTQWVSVYL